MIRRRTQNPVVQENASRLYSRALKEYRLKETSATWLFQSHRKARTDAKKMPVTEEKSRGRSREERERASYADATLGETHYINIQYCCLGGNVSEDPRHKFNRPSHWRVRVRCSRSDYLPTERWSWHTSSNALTFCERP